MPRNDSAQAIVEGLTESQREAVSHGEGPLLVVAGAGSGKTRVITHRIAYLLADGVPPDRVLALTFTNKAADEMRRRVEALVGEDVYVSTFHSWCARFLRREIANIGRDPSFTIYDRTDSLRVIRRIIKDRQLDDATFKPAHVLEFIGNRKDRIIGPADCEEDAMGIEEKTLATAYRDYEEELARNNALDFDDLLLKTLEVFRQSPRVLADYQDTYLHVLVDEYQDTNLAQHLIARALQGKHRNITAVGDPDQMIYSWRGARLDNLLEFEEDFPGTRIVTLERNYRSTGNILRGASACISHNVLRHEKELWTEREGGPPIVLRGFSDSYDEARWVARKVDELINDDVPPSEIAVFYRTKYQSMPLEDAFATLSLPHQVVDSVGFFDRKEVKDLRAYLQLLVNPRDDESCRRIINNPSRGIGNKTLERLTEAAARMNLSLLEAAGRAQETDALGSRATSAVEAFHDLYRRLGQIEADGMRELLKELIELTNYVEGQPDSQREDTREVVDYFLGYAQEYDERNPEGDLMGFLEQAALVSDVDGWKAQARAVPFMTLHSAKGLEFDVVFIVGVEDEVLPHRRALEDRIDGTEREALEEERRLFYVGMTRAREQLYLSHARRRRVQGREEIATPSPFLSELPDDVVEDESPAPPTAPASSAAGFAREMDYVLKKKQRVSLRILDGGDGDRLAEGVKVEHPHWGEGKILEIKPMGTRHMVRVHFVEHGPMVMLLPSEDIAPA
jgi:DNA helicase-2/ATP-dependent DNA helicase PcrA